MQPLSFWWRSWRYLCLYRLTPPPRLVGSCGHSNFFQETKKCRNTKKSRFKMKRFLMKRRKRMKKMVMNPMIFPKAKKVRQKKNPEVLPACLHSERKKRKAVKIRQPRTLPYFREHTFPRRFHSLTAIRVNPASET